MTLKFKNSKALLLAATLTGAAFASVQSQATTIAYTDWVYNTGDEISWDVTVDDTSNDGFFTFNIAIDGGTIGDIRGFGFDTDLNFEALLADYDNFGLEYGDDYASTPLSFMDLLVDYNNVISECTRDACNWNGTAARNPDYEFAVGSQGLGSDDIQFFSFGIPTFGEELTEDTFELVAIRATSVGEEDSRGGSVKDYSATGTAVAVPELNGSIGGFAIAFLVAGLMLRSRTDQIS